ncbi:MAG: hypothetical protein AUI16_17155 [Alphaproteobacteria bacterium 13_2_20CM_2_64_7]|nr:MAG: hypothetical protein AUI16_17155 [Alphaproteobacteria bacterium 13_2_20CM_2_64_7]
MPVLHRFSPDDTAIDDRAHPARINARRFTSGIGRQSNELAEARNRIRINRRLIADNDVSGATENMIALCALLNASLPNET